MKTFIFHLKDILEVYCPNHVNEFKSFETGLLKTKNRLQTHQTFQFYFNQIKKSTTDQKLKSIITVWKNKFKNSFIEDKNLLYLVLMYLFYQIETSIEFLIEGGRLSSLEKDIKEKELKNQCMEKISLKAEIKLTFEEYKDVLNQPEINKEDFNDKKMINDKDNNKNNDNENTAHHSESKSEETTTVQSSVNIVNGTSLSIEEKVIAMEEKILRLLKIEEEFIQLKSEVRELKESYSDLQSKCQQYEMIKIIKAFIRHLCSIFNLPYSSYRIALITSQLKCNSVFVSFLQDKDISLSHIEELINTYYDIKLKLSFHNSNSNNPINEFIDKYASTFSHFSFSPHQSDLINYSSIQTIKTKLD